MEPLYLALGDSTGVGIGAATGGGYPERLVRLLRLKLALNNLCQSGSTSIDVLHDQVPRAIRIKPGPRLITLGIGINDVGLQVPDEAFALNLENIVVALRRLEAPIALLNLPDLSLSPAVARVLPRAMYEHRIELFNVHVTATAARHDLELIDLWSLSREILPGRPELFAWDGFHPSALGYEEWARRMAPQIARQLGVGFALTG